VAREESAPVFNADYFEVIAFGKELRGFEGQVRTQGQDCENCPQSFVWVQPGTG
jgi:hypothetical protein